jgi:hypothetical protein
MVERTVAYVLLAVEMDKKLDVGQLRQQIADRAYKMDGVSNVILLSPPRLSDLESWQREYVIKANRERNNHDEGNSG